MNPGSIGFVQSLQAPVLPAHVSKAKEMHVEDGCQWHESYALAVRSATPRSSEEQVLRRLNWTRQSRLQVTSGTSQRVDPYSRCVYHEEIDVAFAVASHVTIDSEARCVSLCSFLVQR